VNKQDESVSKDNSVTGEPLADDNETNIIKDAMHFN
jgi:hypothetical protein